VALIGSDYVGLRPTMLVAVGDEVKCGQALFTDKRNPGVTFTAPASGSVKSINRGAKRVLESVVIEIHGTESVSFPEFSVDQLASLQPDQIVAQLVESGLWTSLRTRPFSKIPAPDSQPHSLFVTAIDTNPLCADPAVVIADSGENFANGLKILAKLTEGSVFVCTGEDFPPGLVTDAAGVLPDTVKVEQFSGPHPAGLAGTHIHFLDPVNADKIVWSINYQDVISIARLFLTGRLNSERIVSLGGPGVRAPRLLRTCLGANTSDLTANEIEDEGDHRVISGSLLSGFRAEGSHTFVGRYHQQVSVLPEGGERKLFGYLAPGMRQHSVLPVFISSWLNKGGMDFTSSTNGSPRAMVPVGSYEAVMPLDILATQLLRSLLTADLDLAIDLGCLELDEEDLALCTYACPGKYEYGAVLRDVLSVIEKEG